MDILEEGNLSTEDALRHWYYRAKFAALASHLSIGKVAADAALADLGCGLGLFLRMLRRSGRAPEKLSGVDIGFSSVVRDEVDGFALYPNWPKDTQYDAVLLMDVLEHCEDDLAVLKSGVDHVKPGGVVFITVPAFRALWSAHDVFLKHFRRYHRNDVRRLVAEDPRLQIESLHYFYGLLLPAAALQRWLHRGDTTPVSSEMKKLPRALDAILYAVCRIETLAMRLNIVGGLTVMARCRRIV